jgi:hypothetical protein
MASINRRANLIISKGDSVLHYPYVGRAVVHSKVMNTGLMPLYNITVSLSVENATTTIAHAFVDSLGPLSSASIELPIYESVFNRSGDFAFVITANSQSGLEALQRMEELQLASTNVTESDPNLESSYDDNSVFLRERMFVAFI